VEEEQPQPAVKYGAVYGGPERVVGPAGWFDGVPRARRAPESSSIQW
jgi:hypothetical protein